MGMNMTASMNFINGINNAISNGNCIQVIFEKGDSLGISIDFFPNEIIIGDNGKITIFDNADNIISLIPDSIVYDPDIFAYVCSGDQYGQILFEL